MATLLSPDTTINNDVTPHKVMPLKVTPSPRDSRNDSLSDDYDEEVLDPRVQIELEKLNHATDSINRLELELDDARGAFRQLLSESALRLNTLSKKLGGCIEKARPYYEARIQCKETQMETQKAAIRFERANSMHVAAKEMVALAEQGLARQGRGGFDPAWQEMLNHSTMKVNEAEQERIASEAFHRMASQRYQEADQHVKFLQKDLKRNIAKSRPYFETKAKFNQLMEEQKIRVTKLEEQVLQTKKLYAESLRNLEQISDEIHQQREEQRMIRSLGSRESGVGAETPDPPHKVETPSPEHASPPTTESLDYPTFSKQSAPVISLHPPDSDEDDPEMTAVDINDIRDSLREIKDNLSACTTPDRVASPIPQDDEKEDEIFVRPRDKADPLSSPSSVKGISSCCSDGNLSSHLPRTSSSLTSASRSSSFQTRLGSVGCRPLSAALSHASSVDDLDSDTGSVTSVEMLGDQQIEMLMIDDQMREAREGMVEGESNGNLQESSQCQKREEELNQVLRTISLRHSVSLEKLKSIAQNIKIMASKKLILKSGCKNMLTMTTSVVAPSGFGFKK